MGFELKKKEFSSFDEGINYLKNCIKDNRLIAVGGSSYQLPYSYDYHNSNYFNGYPRLGGISNHWMIVCGISDNKVKVRDTTPRNYMGWIDLSDFKNFWMGDKNIPELKSVKGIDELLCFGYIDLIINKKLSKVEVKDISFKVLKTIVHEYLCGKSIRFNEYYIHHGKKAFQSILNDLLIISGDINGQDKIGKIAYVIDQMRFSRYFLRDFLEDFKKLYEDPFYELYEDISCIIKRLDKVSYVLFIEIKRKRELKTYIDSVIQELAQILNMEICFYEKAYLLLEDILLLEK